MREMARFLRLVTREEAKRWLADLEGSHAAGQFFAALTGFCLSGRKPVVGMKTRKERSLPFGSTTHIERTIEE